MTPGGVPGTDSIERTCTDALGVTIIGATISCKGELTGVTFVIFHVWALYSLNRAATPKKKYLNHDNLETILE